MTETKYEKHTTSTDALDTLGSIIDPYVEKRDAIHLAVEPAIAFCDLLPGQHVGIDPVTNVAYPHVDRSIAVEHDRFKPVGIVDPFLAEIVKAGQGFWLVVYPRQINSLRHVWEHEAFAASQDLIEVTVAEGANGDTEANKSKAEAWLRKWAEDEFGITDTPDTYGMTFDDLVDRAVEGDGYLHITGADANGPVPSEFYDHLEMYLGHPITGRADYFSCSC